jgi:hypothetical protein
VPPTGVSTAVLNVTAVAPSQASYLTIYPQGATRPAVASLNFLADQTLGNLVTVEVGSQGGVTVYNNTGSTDVVVDVEGYYTSTPQSTGLYNPVNPIRTFGTQQGGSPIGNGATQAVTVVGGSTGIPVDASAIVANLTASNPTAAGYLTAFPSDVSRPTAANLNFVADQTIGNRVAIPIGPTGQIEIYNYTGTTDVDLDLYGYYTGSATERGAVFVPLTPARFTDTRVATNGTAIAPGASNAFNFASDNIPTTATALVSNVTVVAGVGSGYLAIYPTSDTTAPLVGDINFQARSVAQDFAIAPLIGASVKMYNSSAAAINIVIDAFGYFAPPQPGVSVNASPMTVPSDGKSVSTITANVSSTSGPVFSDPVTFASTSNPAGACGSYTAPGSTNAAGQATSTYTASTVAGTCTITATDGQDGLSGTVTITQSTSSS